MASTTAAAASTMRATEELACETAEVTQGTGAVTSTATATAAVRRVLVAAEQSVHSHTLE